MQRTIENIYKTKSQFFEKINKIDKLLARLTKKRRERTQINKTRNEKGEITADMQKYKKSYKYTMNNCMPTNLTT